MEIKKQPMGEYQTNCYIVTIEGKDLIIDPGVGATKWVMQNVTNPIAILNTHGHFDHIWSNKELSEELNLKIYCPKEDNFMLENDHDRAGMPISSADVLIEPDQEVDFDGTKVKFHHFPGHTPGCSAIQIEDQLFSGDFIFQNSIGRCDFPFSDPALMRKSINKILEWKENVRIHPGHGGATTLNQEKNSLSGWLNYL